jgi:hypothetical protein
MIEEINKEMYVYNKNFTPSQKRFVVAKVNDKIIAVNPDLMHGTHKAFTEWNFAKEIEVVETYMSKEEIVDFLDGSGAMVRFQGPTKKTKWRPYWTFKFDESIEKYEYKFADGETGKFTKE